MADRIITVTDPSIVTNDTLLGYNNYSSVDGQLGTMMTPSEAASGHTVVLSDDVIHEITTKPVGTVNGEFADAVSNAVTVDLAAGLSPFPMEVLNLTEPTAGEWLTGAGSAFNGYGVSSTAITGDFEFQMDMDNETENTASMFGLSEDGTNRRYSVTPVWDYCVYAPSGTKLISQTQTGGGFTGCDVSTYAGYLAGDKWVLKRVGSTVTLVMRNGATDTVIHTFSNANSNPLFMHIAPNTATVGGYVSQPVRG